MRHGQYVRVSVVDTGVGMAAVTLKHAIEPLYSNKGIGKSTGIGLLMVHGLAGQCVVAVEQARRHRRGDLAAGRA